MSHFIKNKKNFMRSVILICTAFSMSLVWCAYVYLSMTNNDNELIQSKMVAEQYKMLFETDRQTLSTVEPIIDASMSDVLKDLAAKVKSDPKNVNSATLKKFSKEYLIAGIWLIEADKVIRVTSSGDNEIDTSDWFKERKDITWEDKLEWLFSNTGSVWIDKFVKNPLSTSYYMKSGYISLGNIPELGGKIVIEIGASIDNAYDISSIKRQIKENSAIRKNIVRSQFIPIEENITKNQVNDPKYSYQLRMDGKVRTAILAQDFNGKYCQILIDTDFPEINRENNGMLVVSIGSSLFLILAAIIIVIYYRGKNR